MPAKMSRRPVSFVPLREAALTNFSRIFDAIHILCYNTSCDQVRKPNHWSNHPEVRPRRHVFDGMKVDNRIIDRIKNMTQYEGVPVHPNGTLLDMVKRNPNYYVGHRIRTLLAVLNSIVLAAASGVSNVLVLEVDTFPAIKQHLSPRELQQLQLHLRTKAWSVLRAGGTYYEYTKNTNLERPCPLRCACRVVSPWLRRVCETRVPFPSADSSADMLWRNWKYPDRGSWAAKQGFPNGGCLVKDTHAFAVHKSTFPVFERMLERALGRLATENSIRNLQREKGIHALFPFIDIWLPARFDALHILPSIIGQERKAEVVKTSQIFQKQCTFKSLSADHPWHLHFSNDTLPFAEAWLAPPKRNKTSARTPTSRHNKSSHSHRLSTDRQSHVASHSS